MLRPGHRCRIKDSPRLQGAARLIIGVEVTILGTRQVPIGFDLETFWAVVTDYGEGMLLAGEVLEVIAAKAPQLVTLDMLFETTGYRPPHLRKDVQQQQGDSP